MKKTISLLILLIVSLLVFSQVSVSYTSSSSYITAIFSFEKAPKIELYSNNQSRTVHYFLVNEPTVGFVYIPANIGTLEGSQIAPNFDKSSIFLYTITPVRPEYYVSGKNLYVRFPISMSSKRLSGDFFEISTETFMKEISEYFGLKIVLYDGAKGKKINTKFSNATIEGIIRNVLNLTGLSYAYGADGALYFGTVEEIQRQFAVFWQIADGKDSVEALKNVLGAGTYAYYIADKSKLFVYGGLREYRLIAEALIPSEKVSWYYISYFVDDKSIEDFVKKLSEIYNFQYVIFPNTKQIAVYGSPQINTTLQQLIKNYKPVSKSEGAKELIPLKTDYPERVKNAILTLYPSAIVNVIGSFLYVEKDFFDIATTLNTDPVIGKPWYVILRDVDQESVIAALEYYKIKPEDYSVRSSDGKIFLTLFTTEDIYKRIVQLIDILSEKTKIVWADKEFLKKYDITILQEFSDGSKLVAGKSKVLDNLEIELAKNFTNLVITRSPYDPPVEVFYSLIGLPVYEGEKQSSFEKGGYMVLRVPKGQENIIKSKVEEIRKSYGKTLLAIDNLYTESLINFVKGIFGESVVITVDNGRTILFGESANSAFETLERLSKKESKDIVDFEIEFVGLEKYLNDVYNVDSIFYKEFGKLLLTGKKEDIEKAKVFLSDLKNKEISVNENKTININVKDKPLNTILLNISNSLNLNLVITEKIDTTITLRVLNVTIEEIFNTFSKFGIKWIKDGNKYVIYKSGQNASIPVEFDKKLNSYDVKEYVQTIFDVGYDVREYENKILLTGKIENVLSAEKFLEEFKGSDKVAKVYKGLKGITEKDILDIIRSTKYDITWRLISSDIYLLGTEEELEKFFQEMSNKGKTILVVDKIYTDSLVSFVKGIFGENVVITVDNGRTILFGESAKDAFATLESISKAQNQEVIDFEVDFANIDKYLNDVYNVGSIFYKEFGKLVLTGSKEDIEKAKLFLKDLRNSDISINEDKTVNINVKDRPLNDVLLKLANVMNLNFVITEKIETSVTLRILNIPLEDLLKIFTKFGISWTKDDNKYVIYKTTEKEQFEHQIVKVDIPAELRETISKTYKVEIYNIDSQKNLFVGNKENISMALEFLKQLETSEKFDDSKPLLVKIVEGKVSLKAENQNVDDILKEIFINLGVPFYIEKIDIPLNKLVFENLTLSEVKDLFSTWVDFKEVGNITFITNKTVTEKEPSISSIAESKTQEFVSVKDNLISIYAEDMEISEIIKAVFEKLKYPLVLTDKFERKSNIYVDKITFDGFKTLMLGYGVSITERNSVFFAETTPESTRVTYSYTFNAPKEIEKVKSLIEYFGGKAFVNSDTGVVIATGIDPKNIVEIQEFIDEISKIKLVSIKAQVVETTGNKSLESFLNRFNVSLNGVSIGNVDAGDSMGLKLGIVELSDLGQLLNDIKMVGNLTVSNLSLADIFLLNDADGKLLASPNIVAKSGENAKIHIGEVITVLIPTREGELQEKTLQPGITLNIIPKVNADNSVEFKLDIEISSTKLLANNQIVVDTRNVSTTLSMRNGQTLIIGGLSKEETYESYSKVPILGDLPVIGKLFRRSNTDTKLRNITVILTTEIIEK